MRKWLLIWAAGFLIPVLWSLRLLLGRPSVVQPSPETTFLTGETLPDGSLDFSAALWKHCNTPVPDEDNAAIALRDLSLPAEPTEYLLRQVQRDSRYRDTDRIYFGQRIHSLRHLVESQPWNAVIGEKLTEYLEENSDWREQWMSAIRRPEISKPVGMPIERIGAIIDDGVQLCLLNALADARNGRWDRIVELHEVIDRAADHLARLQCGWMAGDAFDLHRQSSGSLTHLVVRHTTPVSPELRVYIEKRMEWPIEERLSHALDNAWRIRKQTYVRDLRSGDLRGWLGGALLGHRDTHAVQLQQLRNVIDWTVVARIQNDAMDDYVSIVRSMPNFDHRNRGEISDQLEAVEQLHNDRADFGQLIEELRHLNTANISEGIGWEVATRSASFWDVFHKAQAAHDARVEALRATDFARKPPSIIGGSRRN